VTVERVVEQSGSDLFFSAHALLQVCCASLNRCSGSNILPANRQAGTRNVAL
jgi:hypothetical protein